MLYIKNAKLVLENGILWDGVVVLNGGVISEYGDASQIKIPAEASVLDAKGLYVGPGFVDIHVHGGGGYFFCEAPEKAARFFLKHGETTVLPTLYYNLTRGEFLSAIRRIKSTMASAGAENIQGFYMEGPYMNPKYGALPEKNMWRGTICQEDYREIVDEAGTLARVWAVAPERKGIEPFLEYVRKKNPQTVFSVGHSEATPEQIRRLKKYRFTLLTHCMDATGRVSKWAGTRGAGPDEACFLDSDMYAELICDSRGIHVSPDLIRLILKIKGIDKVVLITDSFVSSEQPPDEALDAADLQFDESGGLCGSKLTMVMACRNLMAHTNCGIAQAFLMASRNPARAVGMDNEIGTIAVGKRSDLVLVDDTFNVNTVILGGRICR